MAKKDAPSIRIQERDVRLLTTIGELGVLDTDAIREFFFPDAKVLRAVQNRLSKLVANGYLKKHAFSEPYRSTPEKRPPRRLPTIYQLNTAGVKLVAEQTGRHPLRPGRSDSPGPNFLLHRLGVARTRLVFDEAFRRESLPCPDWIHEEDAYPDAKVGDRHADRLVLHETFRSPTGVAIPNRPDAEAKIAAPGVAMVVIASIEYDRDTMDVKDVVAKLDGYERLWSTGAYKKRWPMLGKHLVRAFFICPSQSRVESLIRGFEGHPAAVGVRLVTSPDLTPSSALFEKIWWDASGGRRRLLEPPKST